MVKLSHEKKLMFFKVEVLQKQTKYLDLQIWSFVIQIRFLELQITVQVI